jgi:sortase (surface protein transpeptidase)
MRYKLTKIGGKSYGVKVGHTCTGNLMYHNDLNEVRVGDIVFVQNYSHFLVTSCVEEIIDSKPKYVKFRTHNSFYMLEMVDEV